MSKPVSDRDTARRILAIASQLVQTRGFNGFSYADIAAALGVTKASLHYHFPTKADLGRTLIDTYARDFAQALARIDTQTGSERERLKRYARLYAAVLGQHRMCLCGMLAAETATLPAPMTAALKQFFELNEHWLEGVLTRGRAKSELRFADTPRVAARVLLSSLEGAMMLAYSWSDPSRFDAAAEHLLGELGARGEKTDQPQRRPG